MQVIRHALAIYPSNWESGMGGCCAIVGYGLESFNVVFQTFICRLLLVTIQLWLPGESKLISCR